MVLGIVVFFVSGTTGANPSINLGLPNLSGDIALGGDPSTDPIPRPIQEGPGWQFPPEDVVERGILEGGVVEGTATGVGLSPIELAVVVAAVGGAILLGLLLLYVAAVMEFVFVRIAATETVRIRGFFGESTRLGFSLFLFRIAVAAVAIGSVAAIAILTFVTGGLFLLFVLLASPVILAAVIALWLLVRFTIDFVVPVMLQAEIGILEGWRRFWPTLRDEWKEYGVYAAVRIGLGIVASAVTAIGAAAIAIVLAIPLGLVGLLGVVLLAGIGAETAAIALGVLAILVFVLALLVAVTVFIAVPVRTYLRYYPLFVLGAVSPEFDLLEDVRAAIESADADGEGSPTEQ